MCPDTVWEEELCLGWSDNLCITCLVKRLGREPQSFTDIFPANAGGIALNELVPLSDRLLQIMRPKTKRKKWILRSRQRCIQLSIQRPRTGAGRAVWRRQGGPDMRLQAERAMYRRL
jgi:hypothetical protein